MACFYASREWLVDEAILRAKAAGYTVYTTTLRAAWERAIDSITESLDDYIACESTSTSLIGIHAEIDYRYDKRFKRLRKVAEYHRAIGVTAQMYIGLFKILRDLYVDVLANQTQHFQSESFNEIFDRQRLIEFFDGAEISTISTWHDASRPERLSELQNRALAANLEKDKYLAVFESLRDPSFLLDHQRKLLNANQMASSLFVADTSPGEIYYHGNIENSELENIVETATRKAALNVEQLQTGVWIETLHGNRCFDVREREIQDACDNKPIGYVVILHDVTAHREATEKAQQADRVKSAFLATMSHEIRTPLHGVLGATELLKNATVEERSRYIETIETTGQHLLQTLTNVLDYSGLENGVSDINADHTDVLEFYEEFCRVATLLTNQAARTLRVEEDLNHECLYFDPSCVRQVLNNLLNNAIKHGSGEISISLRTITGPKTAACGQARLIVEVSDQGVDLRDLDKSQLFEPFFRLSNTTQGTGLGLAICRHLAQSMGGQISTEFRDSTCFKLDIPVQITEKGVKVTAEPPPVYAPGNSDRCLIIDDDVTSTLITAGHLKQIGLSTDTCHSADQALTMIENELGSDRTDVWKYFLIDYQLPDVNGAVLARRIKAAINNKARFIALTANTQLALAQDRHAFDLVITKPASSAELQRALTGRRLYNIHDNAQTMRSTGTVHPFSTLPATSVQTIVNTFVKNWASQIQPFLSSLETFDDGDSLIRQTHRLASSASSVGLNDLTDELRSLESALQTTLGALDSDYWMDRLEVPMRRAPILVREIAERTTSQHAGSLLNGQGLEEEHR